MSNHSNADISEVDLQTLRLRPGIFLQTQHVAANSPKFESQFIAAIDGKGIMLAPFEVAGVKTGMKAGEEYLIRGFTGQHDFSFSSQVILIFELPFAYTLLAYPSTVKIKTVRKSMRMKTSLPATVSPRGQKTPVAATLIDLSVAGAMIKSPSSLSAVGSQVDLNFSVEFEGDVVDLVIVATICHGKQSDPEEGFMIGLSFKDMPRNDKLILHYFTQLLAEEM
jgi:hypothetical protein